MEIKIMKKNVLSKLVIGFGVLWASTSFVHAEYTLAFPAESKQCRNGNKTENPKFCHNCLQRFSYNNKTYVSWTFVVEKNGVPTQLRVRGELKCNGNYGNETAQKEKIKTNAQEKLDQLINAND